MTISNDAGPDRVLDPNSSGIKVIVVGLGIAGLSAAIECHRKGHSVLVLERIPVVHRLGKYNPHGGDAISIGANAARVTAQWENGTFHDTLQLLRAQAESIDIMDYTGRFLARNELEGYTKAAGYTINRGALVAAIYDHCRALGITVRLGCLVTDYWETEDEAGVIVDGERIEGTASYAQKETGYSTFRGYMSTEKIAEDPDTQWILENTGDADRSRWWIGNGDAFNAEDNWSGTVDNINNILECIKDWPIRKRLEAVIHKVSLGQFIDQKMMRRKPLKTWLSPQRRMMLIGDAAHPTLPSSGQGGSQAIEDGAVVAITLELAGKRDIPLALLAAEKIRHQRASLVQLGTSKIQDFVFKGFDGEALRKDPGILSPPRLSWILDHDCQEYTYDEFPVVADAIHNDLDYVPRNIPKPHAI
ncbi:hypothetical protein N7516_010847 [Penicillium verrucosum]|uniref:uncharacterized protein n=1 Tax=Penicillium verrucosum TaxID=60171 RepID=UPI002545A78F|nr:uncharacterized protein N7516_010847 [Penicillium verrucosum]KAJ5923144.1 hypothetical protein N7516_010847 [Penicillium verrucosum]